MSERVDDPDKPPSRNQLDIAILPELPRTLGELAGEANIAAGLEKKLGEDAFWLFARSIFAYSGEDEYVFYDDTEGIPIPVQYTGLRYLADDEDDSLAGYRSIVYEQLAVFTVESDMLREIEQYYSHAIYDYSEMAVRLGQAISLLEIYEFNPRITLWHQRQQRPYLIQGYRQASRPQRRRPT